ncbi:ActS/PrrB/RegB family redox-sensitive histidine kinase [Donghicola sp. C2-DW-16]|uniref:histidine kinase n=1 Tax=Donghicola mangrovi TaxID=2729614 RepID=A0A850Q775_9RHOB|nr:ActS/PrrB/RegB family redox-sensitive histidine kinase [Donghicola mangrovi]NVO22405.1 ActS/PrrB/RegB family redox-sensitive histidine kinase [Donghicola mangrovi]NVO26004.1 ActS/PrrB/RegB family redox-sensitive histidine kinase [Donghicola mangrovi]
MADTSLFPTGFGGRNHFVRLRTMILLRWLAIGGQLGAIIVAQWMYGLQLEIGLCFMAVGVSVIGNLISLFVFPQNKRLSETENFLMVLFDILQLGFLLYLTGGLHNPFALLILGPVTVSSAVMGLRSFLLLGVTAVVVVTFLAKYHILLHTQEGEVLRVPDLFVFGTWVAIVIGVMFLGLYARRVTSEMHTMSDALQATQMALAREQKLTDLGGVVAAAAHELGTPLATIKLTSAELAEELDDRPDLQEDALLIREQADRCRDILRSMGRAGKDDLHLRQAPLTTVLEEAAEPHRDRGSSLIFDWPPEGEEDAPAILRRPELIHGIRNLVQNAVDFSRSKVWIEARWTENTITVRIIDDGQGYPVSIIGRIGDPFVRRRRAERDISQRPEYEGMGLGLFIAKTLLERLGAELTFANGSDPLDPESIGVEQCGAIVEVILPRANLEASRNEFAKIGVENPRFQ